MARRGGVQAEVGVGLALVMAAATAVLAAVLVSHHERALRPLLARALQAEAASPLRRVDPLISGTRWWRLGAEEGASQGTGGDAPGAEERALAREARERGAGLLLPGPPDGPIRFATPLADGSVAVARLPESASVRLRTTPRRVALGVLLVDALIFTAFGAGLLRRRIVLPLRRLEGAVEAIAEGDGGARVAEDGPREVASLARRFNEMGEALERRSSSLEKAVADLREANRRLRQAHVGLDRAERLAAVGRLAAGVAHEVGNPLGAILAFHDLALRDPTVSGATREVLERAAREGERVRKILRQLLDFSSPARGQAEDVDLARAAEEAAGLVRAQKVYAEVQIDIESAEATPVCRADPDAVAQILLNLLLNAADAVRGRPDGRIRVRVQPSAFAVRPGEGPEAARARRAPDAVECRVVDNGAGVAPEDRERIFDPFYTTRPPGDGTGLGLSNALRQAEEWGGRLDLGSPPPEGGAVFVLRLPAKECAVRTGLRGSDPGGESPPS